MLDSHGNRIDMPFKTEPALTPEQWQAGGFDNGCGFGVTWNAHSFTLDIGADRFVRGEWLAHAIAAAMLHGHPSGFTHKDVEFLRRNGNGFRLEHDLQQYHDLADRIAALLPPEKP